jgi:two-component system nitrate/nitrite sensor histidine kinase NarX
MDSVFLNPFRRSLLLRTGLVMGAITALALLGMASSLVIARFTHGEGAAINVAGSLRMQSYRIASRLSYGPVLEQDEAWQIAGLIDEFEQRLTSQRLLAPIPDDPGEPRRAAWNRVHDQWQQEIKPLLLDYSRHSARAGDHDETAAMARNRDRYFSRVNQFVADIDYLVRLLEEDADSNIQLLGVIQAIALFLTLSVLVGALILMQKDVLRPLRNLLLCAERAGQGDLSVRAQHTGEDELGRLGFAFNSMAADLSKMYQDLESLVEQKTAELTRSNRSLALLYDTSRRLTEAPVDNSTYRALLQEIEALVGIGPSTLCLADPDLQTAHLLTRTGAEPPFCVEAACRRCMGNGETHVMEVPDLDCDVLAVPVRDQEEQYGTLLFNTRREQALEGWQVQLLEAVGQHIGMAVGVTRRILQRRRLALLEERGVIARELHDSLAQSLSYLKIQVTRLRHSMRKEPDPQHAAEVLEELGEGVSAAYRQLRELLNTFRLRMHGQGLGPALADTVREYSERGGLELELDNQLHSCELGANQEIHVLQIVREALANVVQHSQASRATVRLDCRGHRLVTVIVEDNGIGMPQEAERIHHYGLAIMRERAATLGGEIRFEPGSDGGTRVSLQFKPAPEDDSQSPMDIANSLP